MRKAITVFCAGLIVLLATGGGWASADPSSGPAARALDAQACAGTGTDASVGNGTVSGTVTDAVTGLPIAGAIVKITPQCPWRQSQVTTNASGAYSTSGIGNYYFSASATGYVTQIHPGLNCQACRPEGGALVTMADGVTTTVDFALRAASAPPASGTITGKLTDASTGLPVRGSVKFISTSGNAGGVATADVAGIYTSPPLTPGSYYVRTTGNVGNLVNVAYPNVTCAFGCPDDTGTPVTVTTGAATTANFALDPGGSISGTFLEPSWTIDFYDANGGSAGNTQVQYPGNTWDSRTGSTGGLPPGIYYAWAHAVGFPSIYMPTLYPDVPCYECPVTGGTPIVVTAGSETANISFAPEKGARINVTSANSLARYLYTSTGKPWRSSGGPDPYFSGLLPGSYYVESVGMPGYGSRVFPNVDCPNPWPGSQDLPPDCRQGATLVTVSAGETKSIDLPLVPGGDIQGKVKDSATGWGPPNFRVAAYNSVGREVGFIVNGSCSSTYSVSDPDGIWGYSLPAGTYFLKATSVPSAAWRAAPDGIFRSRVFEGLDCGVSCDVTAGTPISVTAGGVATANLELYRWVRPQDLNNDKRGDILWRHSGGALYVWLMNGRSLSVGSSFLSPIDTSWQVKAIGDMNGDGTSDILWRHTGGNTYVWFMDGASLAKGVYTSAQADNTWTVEGLGDFNGDGKQDILWRHSGGALYVWLMDGATVRPDSAFLPAISLQWQIEGIGDFNGDGKADVLWRDTGSGAGYLWLMNGATAIGTGYLSSYADNTWTVQGVGDMDGDGKSDILWRHEGGALYVWIMDGTTVGPASAFLPPISLQWQIQGLRDFDGDGRADVLWREQASGNTYMWFMNGAAATGVGYTSELADASWTIQAQK